jgi:hypothetical protein
MGGAGVLAGVELGLSTMIFRAESDFLERDLRRQALFSTPYPPPRATATAVLRHRQEAHTRSATLRMDCRA